MVRVEIVICIFFFRVFGGLRNLIGFGKVFGFYRFRNFYIGSE